MQKRLKLVPFRADPSFGLTPLSSFGSAIRDLQKKTALDEDGLQLPMIEI